MEDRRRADDKNWEDIKDFISESREYRSADIIKQNYQVKFLESLNDKVKIQNGRVYKLEEWKEIIEAKIKQRKDNYTTVMAWITIIATVVMSISATITIFKK